MRGCDYCDEVATAYIVEKNLRKCLACTALTGNPYFIKPQERSPQAMQQEAARAEKEWGGCADGIYAYKKGSGLTKQRMAEMSHTEKELPLAELPDSFTPRQGLMQARERLRAVSHFFYRPGEMLLSAKELQEMALACGIALGSIERMLATEEKT